MGLLGERDPSYCTRIVTPNSSRLKAKSCAENVTNECRVREKKRSLCKYQILQTHTRALPLFKKDSVENKQPHT